MKTFEEWKASLQVKLDKLRAMRGQRGYDRARLSIILTLLNIADWSKSAAEAVDWIDGKYDLVEEHRTNLDHPDAAPFISNIRHIAESEAKVC